MPTDNTTNSELDNVLEIVPQSTLENQIENDAASLMNKKALEQEKDRLERALNKISQLKRRRKHFENRMKNATRISAKKKLKDDLAKMETEEFTPALQDIKEINERIATLQKQMSQPEQAQSDTSKRSGESQKEYLIRTGQITAFGNKSGFEMDDSDQDNDVFAEMDDNDENVSEESSSKMSGHKRETHESDESYHSDEDLDEESDYEPENVSDEPNHENDSMVYELKPSQKKSLLIKSSDARDDGDELHYQKRLHQWTALRSEVRTKDFHPNDPEWFKPHPKYKDAHLNDGFKIPGEIFAKLFNYQKTAVQWLWELHQQNCGGILGDEMGLGKTIQIIAFLASLHHSKKLNKPILIVCPATLMKQWVSELHFWWPPFRSIILHSVGSGFEKGKNKMSEQELEELLVTSEDFSYQDYTKSSNVNNLFSSSKAISSLVDKVVTQGHIVITTYVGLKIYSKVLLDVDWGYVILDEGHKIRNPNADISLTCKKLRSKHRLILSGTPIQNNLNELWSIFDFVYPGKLGTLPVFQQQFALPISMGGYANATNLQVQTGYKCAVVLRNLISPYFLRRVKADVAKDLPEKSELVLFCKLTKYQRDKYLEFLNSEELAKIKRGKMQVLYGIDVLRKICNHPDLLVGKKFESERPKDYGNPLRSGKMQVVKQLLLKWKQEGHKTLLFTQTKQMLDIIQDFISVADEDMAGNLTWLRMDGSSNIATRQKLVDEFNNEAVDVFLLTTRVGGLGVNLVGASRIIIFDPDWNPSTDLQARERAWRIGQTKEVTIYRLMISGSIEEKIYHRQIFKQFLTNKILKDPNQKRFFKMNELHDLFTLGAERGQNEEFNRSIKEVTQREEQNMQDDFENVAGVSKLEGFYNVKEEEEKTKSEDQRMMEGLFGVEGVVDHDNIVGSHMRPSEDIISREASKAAERAAAELKKSRKVTKSFKLGVPTWTGKFGVAGKVAKPGKDKSKGKNSTGSLAILSRMKSLKHAPESEKSSVSSSQTFSKVSTTKDADPSAEITGATTATISSEINQIKDYLSSQPDNFASSANVVNALGIKVKHKNDIIRIRALLRKIATFDVDKKGWALNQEFRNQKSNMGQFTDMVGSSEISSSDEE
ncbi:hypothetical protein ACO0QE_004007 [Hanseniaspora vineae]